MSVWRTMGTRYPRLLQDKQAQASARRSATARSAAGPPAGTYGGTAAVSPRRNRSTTLDPHRTHAPRWGCCPGPRRPPASPQRPCACWRWSIVGGRPGPVATADLSVGYGSRPPGQPPVEQPDGQRERSCCGCACAGIASRRHGQAVPGGDPADPLRSITLVSAAARHHWTVRSAPGSPRDTFVAVPTFPQVRGGKERWDDRVPRHRPAPRRSRCHDGRRRRSVGVRIRVAVAGVVAVVRGRVSCPRSSWTCRGASSRPWTRWPGCEVWAAAA